MISCSILSNINAWLQTTTGKDGLREGEDERTFEYQRDKIDKRLPSVSLMMSTTGGVSKEKVASGPEALVDANISSTISGSLSLSLSLSLLSVIGRLKNKGREL